MDNLTRSCRICSSEARRTHEATILGKFTASYYLCPECEYWFIDGNQWQSEAYSDPISRLDTGLVKRNFQISQELALFLKAISFRYDSMALDFAGGTGLLTRLMRDYGFNFFWCDEYSENIHALGFERDSKNNFELITLVEVLEHIEHPLHFMQELKHTTSSKFIIFTQILHSNDTTPNNWWYFMPETGQHISFYSAKTLQVIADRLDMKFHKFGNLFIFSTEIQSGRWKLWLSNIQRLILNKTYSFTFRKYHSLTTVDHDVLKSKI